MPVDDPCQDVGEIRVERVGDSGHEIAGNQNLTQRRIGVEVGGPTEARVVATSGFPLSCWAICTSSGFNGAVAEPNLMSWRTPACSAACLPHAAA